MFVGRYQKSSRTAGGVANSFTDLRIHHSRDHADQMTWRAELSGPLLAAEIAYQNFKQIAFNVRILRHKRNRTDDVHCASECSSIWYHNGRPFKNLPRALRKARVFGQLRQKISECF